MNVPDGTREGDHAPERASSLSAEEFAAQFRESSRVMWLLAVGIVGNPVTAEDVVQEAAIVALRKLRQFEPGTSLRAWVGRIVRNIALNALRGERRRRNAMHALSDMAVEAQKSADKRVDEAVNPTGPLGREFDKRIVAELDGMGDVARSCLLLRTIGELAYSEISELLDIPEGTAMSHVHRARQSLRESLADVWAERLGDRTEGGTE